MASLRRILNSYFKWFDTSQIHTQSNHQLIILKTSTYVTKILANTIVNNEENASCCRAINYGFSVIVFQPIQDNISHLISRKRRKILHYIFEVHVKCESYICPIYPKIIGNNFRCAKQAFSSITHTQDGTVASHVRIVCYELFSSLSLPACILLYLYGLLKRHSQWQ